MAIWPFGRKNKRHSIQMGPDDAAAMHVAFEQDVIAEPTLVKKPTRRSTKRHNKGKTDDHGTASVMLHPTVPLDRQASTNEPQPHVEQQQDGLPGLISRHSSLLKKQPSVKGPNKLRRKLSKRKAEEILREREIKMLSSTPSIQIPHRTSQHGDDGDHPRRRGNNRRLQRNRSTISLSIQDSRTSSMSDFSDTYTFKVNAFAALTPRPAVRYVEPPQLSTNRSRNVTPSGRSDKERLAALTSEENPYHSKRRMKDLADSLDAGDLRELLDRDRRRREKKQIEEQERLRRKLQERADAHLAKAAATERIEAPQMIEVQVEVEVPQEPDNDMPMVEECDETTEALPVEPPEPQIEKVSELIERASIDSAQVLGTMDGGSIRSRQLVPRPSFALSFEPGTSRTTLSHSSFRQGISSNSHNHAFGTGSVSDMSERPSSDVSGQRGSTNTITSLFRRGSSRLKRYRDRHNPSPEVSNASHESFYKISTPSSPPRTTVVIPTRPLISPPGGAVMRAQSKFTEHFGDEPLSPPDSRLQSPEIPDIPEQLTESALEHEEDTFMEEPAPSGGIDIINPRRRRSFRSWTESFDANPDNVPLSQSLASIDSEGSWMSGQYFKRMSGKNSTSSPHRTSFSPFGPVDMQDERRESLDSRRISNYMEDPELESESVSATGRPADVWLSEVGRRPVVVNPTNRPKSTAIMLKSIAPLNPIASEEDDNPESETRPTLSQRIKSSYGEIDHI
ncbi:hypothetical protein N7495_005292 [Penicillium taxi]|uniref:uncharacterized protein n=1 Tax=Penicillium taxi TaxID=168475 RepID=UPI0025450CA5|nr:uncharacterized protein N7495_005292 [Penicillium taxi]KAJ5893601.1 hypothetical protein N7495_005292 [Penicillium taxi]